MPVSISQWRAEIGMFNNIPMNFSLNTLFVWSSQKCVFLLIFITCLFILHLDEETNAIFNVLISSLYFVLPDLYACLVTLVRIYYLVLFIRYFSQFCHYIIFTILFNFFVQFFFHIILTTHEDIEVNPGPLKIQNNISICHWNLNSLTSHNSCKLSLLQAYNSIHNYDILCLSETYLNSTIDNDDRNLTLNGYKLVRADHPSNVKRGGVAIYYKESLAARIVDTSYLKESLLLEITLKAGKCFVATVYRSPSQSSDDFEIFLNEFEKLLNYTSIDKRSVTAILGDFNSRCSRWWEKDKNTQEGIKLDSLTSSYGFNQLIDEPTHITRNSFSCIDLIFTNQPELTVDYGIHSSLHPNCYHQLTYLKTNMETIYPPPYERVLWDYKKANVDMIRRSLNYINWVDKFKNMSVNSQVETLDEILLNVFSNFVPNKSVSINDKDPPWMNKLIKVKINTKNKFYKSFVKNGRKKEDYDRLIELSRDVSITISMWKEQYLNQLALKLSDMRLSPKTYWTILKTFYNGKKVPLIPPLLINNQLVSDFKTKANHFNHFFSQQCIPLANNSVIPEYQSYETGERLSSIVIQTDDILKIIRNLNVNKAHGHDEISIRMLKICDSSIVEPLMIIFKNCLKFGIFPDSWKKSNIVPIHKKGDKQILNNYRPVSLLPVCGKIFERIIFKNLYEHLEKNNLLSSSQSGFKSSDSCTYQLLSITHLIYSGFDYNPSLETRGVFLDISKAFDKVWHNGLIYKLRSVGVTGELLTLIKSFIKNRSQRVVLNGQSSSWLPILAGVPQGSILGPLFFLVYINDLSSGLKCEPKLFADDTSLFSVVYDKDVSSKNLNDDLDSISNWAFQWKMSFNPDPSKQAQEIIFSRKKELNNDSVLCFNELPVKQSNCQKHLGMQLDKSLNFNLHIQEKIGKANKGLGILRKLNCLLPRKSLLIIYKAFIRPHLDYGDIIYDQPNNESFCRKIESVQYNAALAITGAIRGTSQDKIYQELGLESLRSRRWFRKLCTFYKIKTTKCPKYLYDLIPSTSSSYSTRISQAKFNCRTNFFSNSFFPYTLNEWNKLDEGIRTTSSFLTFRKNLLNFIRPSGNSIFDINDALGIKLLTRLRLGFSHLNEHKFRHNFRDSINPLCSCSANIETTEHFFLHCHFFDSIREKLVRNVSSVYQQFLQSSDKDKVSILLYGKFDLELERNREIIKASIEYMKNSLRFSEPLI